MTRLNGNSGSSIDDFSERRLVAFKRARIWFWILLAAPTAVALYASVLVFSSNQNHSGLGTFAGIFAYLEMFIIIPFLIHAFFTRYVIRRSWLLSIRAFFTVLGGTIGIVLIPFPLFGWIFPSFGEIWLLLISNYEFYSRFGQGQDLIIMIIAIPSGVASAVCGYILGFGLGLIAERLIVGNQAQGKYAEAKTHSDRGVAHYYLGEKARAIEDYDQALRIDPGNAATYNDRGVAYYDLGDSRRAIEDYDTALRIDPDYAYAYNNRGNAYNRLAWDLYLNHSNAEALTYVDRALADRLNEAAIIGTRAHVLAALGRRREAVDEFERATQMGGSDLVRRYQEALKKHGHYRGAIDGAYGPNTRAALVACINAGCRLLE